jgi:hypothetical protein
VVTVGLNRKEVIAYTLTPGKGGALSGVPRSDIRLTRFEYTFRMSIFVPEE